MIRRPPRSTLFPTRRSSDLGPIVQPCGSSASARRRRSFAPSVAYGRSAANAASDCPYLKRYLRDESKPGRSEEHTSELQSPGNLVCRLLLEKKKTINPLNSA